VVFVRGAAVFAQDSPDQDSTLRAHIPRVAQRICRSVQLVHFEWLERCCSRADLAEAKQSLIGY